MKGTVTGSEITGWTGAALISGVRIGPVSIPNSPGAV